MTLPNKKFINMDKNTDNTWWVDVLDTSLEHPRILREEFATEEESKVYYDQLMSVE
jgi:Mg2+ and Co2+ transporter CorA